MKKLMWALLNVVLALLIIAIIIATWMPAIYTSEWFHKTFPKL